MTDIFSNAWCDCCGEITAHIHLGQRRLECTTEGCHETRDADANQQFPPNTPVPLCPTCLGSGYARIDDAYFAPKEGSV